MLHTLLKRYAAHRLKLLYIAATRGWPATIYYDQQGADEYLDLTPRVLGRVPAPNQSDPAASPDSGPVSYTLTTGPEIELEGKAVSPQSSSDTVIIQPSTRPERTSFGTRAAEAADF
jgi:hypothetical protein